MPVSIACPPPQTKTRNADKADPLNILLVAERTAKIQGLLCTFLISGWWGHVTSSGYCLISAANRRSVEECNALPPISGSREALLWATSMLLFIGCNVGCPAKPQSKWQRKMIWRLSSPASWLLQRLLNCVHASVLIFINTHALYWDFEHAWTLTVPLNTIAQTYLVCIYKAQHCFHS